MPTVDRPSLLAELCEQFAMMLECQKNRKVVDTAGVEPATFTWLSFVATANSLLFLRHDNTTSEKITHR